MLRLGGNEYMGNDDTRYRERNVSPRVVGRMLRQYYELEHLPIVRKKSHPYGLGVQSNLNTPVI